MNFKIFIATAASISILTGCSGDSGLDGSADFANSDLLNGSQDTLTAAVEQLPTNTEQELTQHIFFDGSSLTDDGIRLIQNIKSRSNLAFENLNSAFAEGTLSEEFLACSLYKESNVLYGYACQDERPSALLDEFGFPLFVITTVSSNQCSELPIGAFNSVDCELGAFNFISDSGLFGYYRSFRDEFEITRESLTITTENVPAFIDPTFLPETCVFELFSDGNTLVSDFDNCTDAIDNLLADVTN